MTTPSDQTERDALPPLPEPAGRVFHDGDEYESSWVSCNDAFTDDQMHTYGRACVLADRASRAEPAREHLASLLAALHFGQYATNEDKARLDRSINRALRWYDIGSGKFATPPVPSVPAPSPLGASASPTGLSAPALRASAPIPGAKA